MPHSLRRRWLLIEGVVDGDGGFNLGRVSIEEIGLVGPLPNSLNCWIVEHGVRRRVGPEGLHFAVLADDCVENDRTVHLRLLGHFWIDRRYEGYAIARHQAAADMCRFAGFHLVFSLNARDMFDARVEALSRG